MPPRFDAHLVNDPFGDPGLLIELMFERRALLFDLGNLSPLPPRKLLRISDVFVSHRHMDHFSGFDYLLRFVLGREQVLNFYGPAGLIDAIGHKLSAYTWNLVAGYEANLCVRAHELSDDGSLTTVEFQSRSGFARGPSSSRLSGSNALLAEPRFHVRAAMLDHGIPSLGFALEETMRINVWRNKVEALGLKIGPWLRELKEAAARGDLDEMPVTVEWREPRSTRPGALPLGQLKDDILEITPGRKIAYVVDAAFTPANAERIVDLARNAEVLFIEAPFLQTDMEHAAARHHLTAHQAGTLAREAQVKRIVTLHYSPRYEGRGDELEREALAAFHGAG
ncbi:MAG: ribonuclease Z [Hyphomicrobiaceae bacterium]|nr:MAG: ribonuclease Z [Hyphomicrobiaceae bacterium]